uniref:Amino acid transporter transmembrane domain-containing protein n=1 Tax=Chenopodium quinoa TaxID=63459 RepID=A0A803MI99_CHEQI
MEGVEKNENTSLDIESGGEKNQNVMFDSNINVGEKNQNVEVDNNVNNELPVASNRKGKWWYAAIHNVTAMVGAGILGLPYAMSQLGWGPGVTILLLSWIVTLYTLWQMVEMHEIVPGKRFDRYYELGQYAFGENFGLWFIVAQQIMVQVGCDIVYMITGGTSLMKVYSILLPNGTPIRRTYFIMIYAFIQFFLSNLPNFNSITGISFVAAIMSLSYSAIAWIASSIKGVQLDTSYGSRYSTDASHIFGFLSGLGTISFAFSGHNVVLEIQATLPSTPEKPSKLSMWKGSLAAYIMVMLCYFPVAFVGYFVFGRVVEDNIMVSLDKPNWLIVIANVFVVIHVIGSYQVYAMPMFDMLESFLTLKMKRKPSKMIRLVTRSTYVVTLHNVVDNLQTQEIQLILVLQLVLHYIWRITDDLSPHWRCKRYHNASWIV